MEPAVSLVEAILRDDLSAAEAAIAAGADVNAVPPTHYQPPLHLAIEHQRIEIVRRLITAGALVNHDLGEGWTPLVHAIDIECDAAWQAHHETGHETTELTELLLTSGARPTKHAFELAEGYDNRKALALMRLYADRR